ncbi:J domain-containing protein [candidate division KSB1 bacterium]|nr:J domain-containing protein [candidate division KSB1 bacterium]
MSLFKRIQRILTAEISEFWEHIFLLKNDTSRSQTASGASFSEKTNGFRSEPTPPVIDAQLARHYAALEIPYGADLATVKSAWRRLQKKYHPDLFSNDTQRYHLAQEISQGLNEALDAITLAFKKNQI